MRPILFSATAAVVLATGPALAQDTPVYATPQDALEALVAALGAGEPMGVAAALGAGADELVTLPDEPVDAAALAELYDDYRAGYRFVPEDDGSVVIELGDDLWPFPVPLVRGEGGWTFDVEAGLEEVALREIGRNELDVIDLLGGYLEVQRDYRLVDYDGDGVLEFAASILSPEGARTGLYWADGEAPVGDLAARAALDGFTSDVLDEPGHEPYFGYYYRVLTGQSSAAPGGEMSYLVNGNMVAGHALLAVPAEYGVSGILTFVINEAGTIWEADLGEETLDTAFEIEVLDPSEEAGWRLSD